MLQHNSRHHHAMHVLLTGSMHVRAPYMAGVVIRMYPALVLFPPVVIISARAQRQEATQHSAARNTV